MLRYVARWAVRCGRACGRSRRQGGSTFAGAHQMLMNLMPALREIRAPLAAGYILLAAAWLSIHDLLPNRVDSKGTLRTIHELIDSVGQGGVAVAASFLALLIGSVMQFIAEAIGRWRNTRRGGPQHDLRDPSSLVAYLGQMFADNPGLVQVAERETRIEEPERVTAHVVSAVSAEIPRIARRMRGTENELFDEYDRLIGEARFRACWQRVYVGTGIDGRGCPQRAWYSWASGG